MADDIPPSPAEPPLDSPQGAAAVFARAQARDPAAMRRAAVLRAAGVHCERDWADALVWLARAAVHGDFAARSELVALSEDEDLVAELDEMEASGRIAPATLWRRFGQSVDLDHLLSPPAGIETALADPWLATVEGMVSARACQWLARNALSQLQTAQVHPDRVGGVAADPHRTHASMSFRLANTGLPLLALRERAAAILGVRVAQLEPTQVLRYETGQTYAAHFDAFADDEAGRALMGASGQRIATLLVSLNANYVGGETEFPVLGANYRGAQGQAVFWANADAAGRRDERTLNAGRPPTSGVKWMVSQWVRARDYVE